MRPISSALKREQAAKRTDSAGVSSVDLEIFFAFKSTEIAPEAASAMVPLGRELSDRRLASNTFPIAGHSDGKEAPITTSICPRSGRRRCAFI